MDKLTRNYAGETVFYRETRAPRSQAGSKRLRGGVAAYNLKARLEIDKPKELTAALRLKPVYKSLVILHRGTDTPQRSPQLLAQRYTIPIWQLWVEARALSEEHTAKNTRGA